jgi:hypothetical protein
MLAWERWTLTHSSGVAVLVLGLGAVLTKASSVAAVADAAAVVAGAAVVAVPVPVGDAEAAWDGDTDDKAGLAAAADDAGALLTLADGVVVDGSLAEAELLADDVPDGDGEVEAEDEDEEDGDPDGDDEGDALAGAGSAWHEESVAALAAGEAACAAPAMPSVSRLPLSNVTVATRTYPKCISIACLRRRSGCLPAVVIPAILIRGRTGSGWA